jgi:hypothetical protein
MTVSAWFILDEHGGNNIVVVAARLDYTVAAGGADEADDGELEVGDDTGAGDDAPRGHY